MAAPPQVLARFSVWKTGALILGFAVGSVWILAEGWANSWAPPPGMRSSIAFGGYGSAPFCLLGAAAFLYSLLLRRGVAIQRSGDALVLTLLFGRRQRVPIVPGLTVRDTLKGQDVPPRFEGLRLVPGRFALPQLTLSRPGAPDVTYPTPLLSEPAAIVIARIAAAIAAPASTGGS